MITYRIRNEQNKIIFESTNYLDTLKKYQEIVKITKEHLIITTKKCFLDKH